MAASAAHFNPVTTIILAGPLRRRFGRLHRRQLDSGRSWEAFKALTCTLEGAEYDAIYAKGGREAVYASRFGKVCHSFVTDGRIQ